MPKKIYIIDNYLQYDFKNQLLNEQDALFDVAFWDFKTFCDTYIKDESNAINNQMVMFELLKDCENALYAPLLASPNFIEELYSIKETLDLNNEDLTCFDLNQNSTQSLYSLLEKCQHIKTRGYYLNKAYKKIQQCHDFSHVVLVNQTYNNFGEKQIINHLIKHNATNFSLACNPHKIIYSHALNKRVEVEIIAREIVTLINNQVPINAISVMVCDNNEYENVLAFVFNRYNIPYYLNDASINCDLKDFFLVLVDYYIKANLDTFKALITNKYLEINNTYQLMAYIDALQLTHADLFAPFAYYKTLKNSPFLNDIHKKSLAEYEVKSNESQINYTAFFKQIQTDSLTSYITSCNDFLLKHANLLSEQDILFANNLKSKLQPSLKTLSTLSFEDGLLYLKKVIINCQNKQERLSNCLLITSIDKPFFATTHAFVLGAHQKAYPNFQSVSGLLNENVILRMKNHLSLDERYHLHIKRMQDNLMIATNLYIFYPQSNYEGKTNESSLDLKMAFNIDQVKSFPLVENHYKSYPRHSLDTQLSKALFFNDQSLQGSITAFERYFKCPYSYFLKYGLKIRAPFQLKISEAEVGTIQHDFLESIIKAKGKAYTTISDEEILAFLDQTFKAYELTFSGKQSNINQTKASLASNLKRVIEKLADLEVHTIFEPTRVEEPFSDTLLTYKNIAIMLKGKIDRIDEIAQGFRIIDYKSSDKDFKQSDFEAGVALQLITYAIYATRKLKKQAFGVYYYTFKNVITPHLPYKVTYARSDGNHTIIPITASDLELEHNKLKGITLVTDSFDLSLLDDTYGHYIKGIKQGNKEERADGVHGKVSTGYDYEKLEKAIYAIYEYLIDQLLDGNIECAPLIGACSYCDYSELCQFKGSERKVSAIIKKEEQED